MSKAALVVIFNHRYEKNVPKLEDYYQERFSHRHYLMPFAPVEDEHIVRVVENSQIFSGHVAQGIRRYKSPDVTHYVFAGDDLILHPRLHESNLVEALQLRSDTAYIKSLTSADRVRFSWQWSLSGYNAIRNAKLDWRKELPKAEEAKAKFQQLGLDFPKPVPRTRADVKWLKFPAKPRSLRETYWSLELIRPYLVSLSQAVASTGKPSGYPLLAGYADFFVVPAAYIDLFAHFCGVFAAMNLFAELAVPTALALSVPQVKTELVLGDHFADPKARTAKGVTLRGMEFWEDQIPVFCKSFNFSWSELMGRFPDDALYFHPVKLSQWK